MIEDAIKQLSSLISEYKELKSIKIHGENEIEVFTNSKDKGSCIKTFTNPVEMLEYFETNLTKTT